MPRPLCHYCQKPINADSDYRRVEGWERHRHQGGTNHIMLREPRDEWACRWCIESLNRGVPVGQQSLLA